MQITIPVNCEQWFNHLKYFKIIYQDKYFILILLLWSYKLAFVLYLPQRRSRSLLKIKVSTITKFVLNLIYFNTPFWPRVPDGPSDSFLHQSRRSALQQRVRSLNCWILRPLIKVRQLNLSTHDYNYHSPSTKILKSSRLKGRELLATRRGQA